ncbi:hypothetical protein EGW08_019005, partial [Elysia chlorotica]
MSTSLFAAVEMINACILVNNENNLTVQQMATDPKPRYNNADHLIFREEYLIHILVGDSQHSNFSLLGQIPKLCEGAEEAGQVNPLAERIVLLSILVLLNVHSGFVRHGNQGLIRREFAKLHKAQGLPRDLQILVKDVTEARTYDSVATAATDYLSRRSQQASDQPYLCSCTWVGRLNCPVTWTALQPGEFPSDLLLESGTSDATADEETRPSAVDEDFERLEDQKKMEAKLEIFQSQVPDSWEEREQKGEQDDEAPPEVQRLFQPFSQITSTECEICDMTFDVGASISAGAEVPKSPVDGKENLSGGVGDMNDIDDAPLVSALNVADSDLQKKHTESDAHLEKLEQLRYFKKVYTRKVS